MKRTRLILDLFFTFSKVGVLTFGGGYSMLPMLQREVVEQKHWTTEEELSDYFAIGQCMPGVIAANTATFIGQKQAGVLGGITATLGVVFPSIVIITLIAALISSFASMPVVQNAFAGIRVCVCVLILNSVVKLWKKTVIDIPTFLIFLFIFGISAFTDVSPVIFVLLSAVAGVVIRSLGVKSR